MRAFAVWGLNAVIFGITAGTPVRVVHAQRIAVVTPAVKGEQQRITVNIDDVSLVTALQAIAQQAGLVPLFERTMIPSHARVTLHLQDVLVNDAFLEVLRGTGLVAHVHRGGNVSIVRASQAVAMTGTIVGKVLDKRTRQPLRGAKVGLGGDYLVETASDGSYRLSHVSPGLHTIAVKFLGYAKATSTVTVQDDSVITQDILLEASAAPLDQVVVTGTVIPTALKAVPNAITVITAKQIEERGITRIDQLFHGDVPGLFSLNTGTETPNGEVFMFSRGATSFGTTAVTNYQPTSPIKTYIDGVEMADPRYLSQIDPKSIERIEILTGPQASTIYGSGAINGVMQVFTKRGTSSTPQLTLNLLSGFVQNNFSAALTPQHDYSGQVTGVEGRLSYNGGATWTYMGPWTPANQTAVLGTFGGVRFTVPTSRGVVTTDVTLRRANTHNRIHGVGWQTNTANCATGWKECYSSDFGYLTPQMSLLTGQTLGFSLSYTPWSWWSNEFGVGQDASDTDIHALARPYTNVSDTTLWLSQTHIDRRSLRYAATARMPMTSLAQATITLGADAWQNLATSLYVSPQTLTGSLQSGQSYSDVERQPGHNTGGFVQAQVGILDQLFVTYGLRAEWNPNFGKAAEPNYAPRYGVAYTTDVGGLTAKLRASYGRSTRPPDVSQKAGMMSTNGYAIGLYGNFIDHFANPALTPEHQQGGEGGLELYFGTRSSLVITRYSQTVNGLITDPVVDSTRSLLPNPSYSCTPLDANGYGYWCQYQFLNIGGIRNQGWELQGSTNTGPFTSKATYSWTKSRSLGMTPKYRAQFPPNQYPQFQPGATFSLLPEHTWALGTTYAQGRSLVAVTMTGTGRYRHRDNNFAKRHFGTRLLQNSYRADYGDSYIGYSNSYITADLTASRRWAGALESVLEIRNLTNAYHNDQSDTYVVMGRQTKAGFRVRF